MLHKSVERGRRIDAFMYAYIFMSFLEIANWIWNYQIRLRIRAISANALGLNAHRSRISTTVAIHLMVLQEYK